MGRLIGPVLFFACTVPLVILAVELSLGELGPDPVQVVMHETGHWGLRLLLLTLCMTPLGRWSGSAGFVRHRRQLGLWMFAYATLHLLLFVQGYVAWSGALLWEELCERPYITAGFAAWLLLLPLAMTSSRASRRRLGRRWLQLHRLIYPALLMGCLHLWWQVRSDAGEAVLYSLLAILLLGWRLYWRFIVQRHAASA